MLSLTRKADYAIVAMADLARRDVSRASARELALTTQVPQPVLTNILHQLLHRGLVTSAMGSKGGYRIARPATQISLAEIIDAIEGPFRLALCCGEATEAPNDSCDLSEACHIREPLRRVNTGLRNYLTQVSLAQITFGDAPIDLKVARRNGDRKAATVE